MKKLSLLLILFCSVSLSQVPQGISHRGTVYNTSGILIVNHLVKIKASILETSSMIYSETHTLTTNASGQYSFNIGLTTGLPSGETNVVTYGAFNTINWTNGTVKELKIEIDPTGAGTNYNVSGQNQLMTVPYAFNAQTVNPSNAIKAVNTINDLRGIIGNVGDVIYVKDHTFPNDGGGGNFIWRDDAILRTSMSSSGFFSFDNDGIIIQASVGGTPNDTGRWVRQYDGYIDVRYFGVGLIGGTLKVQKAIDYASNVVNANFNPPTRGTTIFFPWGTFILDKITLRNGVSIIGDSSDKTIIQATSSGDTDYTSSPYLFEIESGPVNINISNLKIIGNNTNKGCFNFEAKASTGFGGLNNCNFKNISINKFNGHAIYLKALGYVENQPSKLNQLCVFENVYVNKLNDDTNAMRIEGYSGQLTFLNCGFGGKPRADGTTYSKGVNVDIRNEGSNRSQIISFINCSFNAADYGLNVNFGENITVDNCWFEDMGIAVNVMGGTVGTNNIPSKVNILNSRFSNASGFGTKTAPGNITSGGRCINVVDSYVDVRNNYLEVSDPTNTVAVSDDYFVMANEYTNMGVNLLGNTFQDPKLNHNSGIVSVVQSVNSDCKINCRKNKVILVNSSSTTVPSASIIKEIVGDYNTGETIFVRANGGNISFWDVDKVGNTQTGRNIFLSSASNAAPSGVLTLKNGEAAVFTKIHDSVYQLTSIIRATSN